MKKNKEEVLEKLINSSGFLFQIAVEHLVSSSMDQPWSVVSREHPWRSKESGAEGFIDLIFAAGVAWMVCECKRTRDGDWVFIVESKNKAEVATMRCSWVAGIADGTGIAGWDDVVFRPSSLESAFCVIRGSSDKDGPLLERIAGNLLLSMDCLIEEDVEYVKKKQQGYKGVYIPAIITNSRLFACEVDPGTISLADGTIEAREFIEVPLIRFKKTLSFESPSNSRARNLFEATRERERTVLIINSSSLLEILSKTNMKTASWEDPYPWDAALNQLNQGKAKK